MAKASLASELEPQAAARLFICAFHGSLIELKVYKDRRVYDESMSAVRRLLRRPA